MFAQIISLVAVLLIISFAPDAIDDGLPFSPTVSLVLAAVGYFALLIWLPLQNRVFGNSSPENLFKITNIEFTLFLLAYYFILGVQRILPQSLTLTATISLGLYFIFLFVFYSSLVPPQNPNKRIRLLIPFVLPLLLFTSIYDLTPQAEPLDSLLFNALAILLLFLIFLFFPLLAQVIWQTKPLNNRELELRLNAICKRARFNHAGIRIWTILDNFPTAGVFGVLPGLRYIMLTKALLKQFPPRQIEAVLAHEIGHGKGQHLVIYPFIFFGGLVAAALFFPFLEKPLFFAAKYLPLSEALYPLFSVIIFILFFSLYFRLIFGYFSRLFEREADLYIFTLGIAASEMCGALDHLGKITGNTHKNPCWHHFSLRERIEFLEKADEDRSLIARHKRKIGISLLLYSLLLLAGIFILVINYVQT